MPAAAAITGTAPAPSGPTIISDETLWKDENIQVYGNVSITAGGSLTLDHTVLIFASTTTAYYGMEVLRGNETQNGGRLKVINGSRVTAADPAYNTYIYSEYEYPDSDKCPVVQASDSLFSELGKGVFGVDGTGTGPKRYGFEIRRTSSESYFHNLTVTSSFNGIYLGDGGEPVTISNCCLENIEAAAIFVKYVGARIEKNLVSNMKFGVYAQYTDGMQIVGNTFDAQNHLGNYVLDLLGPDKNFLIQGNTIMNFQRGIVMINEQMENGIIENNQFHDAIGMGIGTVGKNIIVRNNALVNPQDGIIGSGSQMTIHDNVITNPKQTGVLTAGLRLDGLQDSTLYNLEIRNVDQISSRGLSIRNGAANLYLKNIKILGAFKYGIDVENAAGICFVDLDISNCTTSDIYFKGSNKNIVFVNARFDAAKVAFADAGDVFMPYYYLNVKVVDADGQPVENAAVNLTNNNSEIYPSINVQGNACATFYTGTDGQTALPSSPDQSIAVLDHAQTSDSRQDMSYSVYAEYKGMRSAVVQVNPEASWYRSDPEALPTENAGSLTLVLPVSQNFKGVRVYPNPYIKGTSNTQIITFANLPAKAVLTIFAANGTLVKKCDCGNPYDGGRVHWDIQNVCSGIYMYFLKTSQGTQKGKVSIAK